jgi:hypothetical protein
MKEFIQKPGVRRWHGDELITIQQSTLDILQAQYEMLGNCIISGCTVSMTTSTCVITPGLVQIMHPDGNKIAKFAGATYMLPLPPTFSYKMYIVKTTYQKLYVDGLNKDASNLYEAQILGAGSLPSGLTLDFQWMFTSTQFWISGSPKWLHRLAHNLVSPWQTLLLTCSAGHTVTASYRYHAIGRQVEVRGSLQAIDTHIFFTTSLEFDFYNFTIPGLGYFNILPPLTTQSFISPLGMVTHRDLLPHHYSDGAKIYCVHGSVFAGLFTSVIQLAIPRTGHSGPHSWSSSFHFFYETL